jgi:hypothetical protein
MSWGFHRIVCLVAVVVVVGVNLAFLPLQIAAHSAIVNGTKDVSIGPWRESFGPFVPFTKVSGCSTDKANRHKMNVMLETARTGTRATKHPFAMKLWLNEFLQNAAFPAMVLAFASSLINNQIRDARAGRSTDDRKAVRTQLSYREGWYQPPKSPASIQ